MSFECNATGLQILLRVLQQTGKQDTVLPQ